MFHHAFYRDAARFLLLIASCLTSWATSADVSGDMDTLQQAKVGIYRLMSQFFVYQGDPGEPTSKSDMQKSLADANAGIGKVEAILSAAALARNASELRGKYDGMLAVYNENMTTIAKNGLADNEPLSKMVIGMQGSVDSLEKARADLAAKSGYRPVPEVGEARNLSVLMQYLDARYMEKAHAAFGTTYRSSAGAEKGIDELAKEFDAGFARLQASGRNTEKTKATLRSIQTKWRFIRGSLINFNEKAVPFTVHRHSTAIVALLNQVAHEFEAK